MHFLDFLEKLCQVNSTIIAFTKLREAKREFESKTIKKRNGAIAWKGNLKEKRRNFKLNKCGRQRNLKINGDSLFRNK